MHMVGHILLILFAAAVFLSGFALFWIARQDDSRGGRLVGLIAMAIGALTLAWLLAGHRLL
jgi:dolichol kinase